MQPTTNNNRLCHALHLALKKRLGPKDDVTLHSIIGFEFGGPPDLLLFSHAPDIKGVIYVTSDLLWCRKQPPNSLGQYELAICLPDENQWAEHVLFKLSQMSLEQALDVGHTVDITAWVDAKCSIKGLFISRLLRFALDGQSYAVLFCVGVTRAELAYAMEHGAAQVAIQLKTAGVFPVTMIDRESVI
jgi:hypothetical protein